MISPTLNINGSSLTDLTHPRIAAYDALQDAIKALQRVTPNGRDYPGDNDRCVADRQAHYDRLAALQAIAAEIVAEAVGIKEQIK
tara:strand:+ start:4298 stop:4552 length:255 start_codon:yes stop_codon:yes gene_type:complete